MTGRSDARFIETSLPTKPSVGISRDEWDTLISSYYPTSYNKNLEQSVRSRLIEFGLNPDYAVPKVGGTIRLNLSSLDGLSEALLTLYSLGHPLHLGALFYPGFNKETRDTVEKRQAFPSYRYKLDYCLIDRIHRARSVKPGSLYRGMDLPFPYKPGDSFSFHQFTSTAVNLDVAQRFLKPNGTLYEIRGSRGLSMANYSQYPQENEFLIHPFQEFSVSSVEQYGNKTWVTLTGN